MTGPWSTPELAAGGWVEGDVLEVSFSPSGRLAVVVLRGDDVPMHVICERNPCGWVAVDGDEPWLREFASSVSTGGDLSRRVAAVEHGRTPMESKPVFRSTWTSTVAEEQFALLDGESAGQSAQPENVGVEFTHGVAPAGTAAVRVRAGHEEFDLSVLDGVFWLVRWDVPDTDDDGPATVDLVRFVEGN